MLSTLLHFASMLLHFVLVLQFVAIVITFCVSITFCGDYYILRRNTGCLVRNQAENVLKMFLKFVSEILYIGTLI